MNVNFLKKLTGLVDKMIEKRHVVIFVFLLFLLIGTVSASDVDNTTETTNTAILNEDKEVINEIEGTLETKDLDMYYKDGAHEVNVYDNDKNPLPDIPVNITVNGITYYRITDDNGFAKLNINLDPGKYEITTDCILGTKHISKLNNINVKPMNATLVGSTYMDVGYKSDKYTVQLVGGNNKPLANQQLTFTINQVSYDRITDENGEAILNINLNPDKVYTIKTEHHGIGHYKSAKDLDGYIAVNTYKTSIIGNNLNIEFRKGKYTVQLVTEKNKPLIQHPVIFTVNGVSYERLTNLTGHASLNINLDPGTYQISYKFEETLGYKGSSGDKLITVKTNEVNLSGEDMEIGYGGYETYFVTLMDDNKPLEGLNIKNEIYKNGQLIDTQYKQTEEDGIARVIINLEPGEYKIKSSIIDFGYSAETISNTLTIIRQNLTAESKDIILNRKGSYFVVNLKNEATNQSVINETVNITVNGITYARVTDNNGDAKLRINLDPGKYEVTWIYSGSNGYKPVSGSNIILRDDNYKLETTITVPSTNISKKGSYLESILKDSNGLPIEGEIISYFVSGIEYKKVTDANGIARLKINLNDGNYSVKLKHAPTGKFGQSETTILLNVNKVPNFNYTIELINGITKNDKSIDFIRDIKIHINGNSYLFTTNSPYTQNTVIKDNENYFISYLGEKMNNDFKTQGINLKLENQKLKITYSGKTNDVVSQFSAIYRPTTVNNYKGEAVDIILENEKIATIEFTERLFTTNSVYDLIGVGYQFFSFEQINTSLKMDNQSMHKSTYLAYGSGELYEWNEYDKYELLETYILGKSKVNDPILNNALSQRYNLDNSYLSDAYDFYIAGLYCLWSSTYINDQLAENNNVSWDRETLVLVYSDWLGIKLDTLGKMDVTGENESNIKNFRINSGIVYSLCEKAGLQLLGIEGESAASEIYEGINEGKSLVIDKIDDQVIIKIANSTNRFVINLTSGSLGAYVNIDSELISDKIQLKGVHGIYGIRYLKPINLQKQVNYQMTVMKNYLEFLNPFNGHIKMDMGVALNFGGRLLPTAVGGIKTGTAGGVVAGLYVVYASNELIVEYRDKYIEDKYWQYFPNRNTVHAKTIFTINQETGYTDFVEIPYDKNGNLDMDNANYVDSITGRRDLTDYEKVIFKNWDY